MNKLVYMVIYPRKFKASLANDKMNKKLKQKTYHFVLCFSLMAIYRRLMIGFFLNHFYQQKYYPTIMRAIGLGTCSTMARVGAIITPFVAQVLLRLSPYVAISIYGTVAFLAALASLLLPYETKGKELKVKHPFLDKLILRIKSIFSNKKNSILRKLNMIQ